jgi:pimeloyl-ACP methyl ester carboxylesterase
MKRWLRVLALIVLAALIVGAGAFLWWAQPQPLLPEATAALASTPTVTFEQDPDGRLTYVPADGQPTIGLILYPGGKVPPAAYAPQAQAIAADGYLVAVVPVPFNLAVFDINAAGAVIADHPEIQTWAVGGHSLGGSMAAQFLDSHRDAVDALVLWASYSAADISSAAVPVASIYGTLDTGVPSYSGAANTAKLGSDLTLTPIEGGNHEQMGWYTGQPNDPPATISREGQQEQVVSATLDLLEDLR